MTTRIQPWTEPELMDRESVFEAQVEKALHRTMRALASEVAGGILTAAATLPVDPAVEGSYATAQGAVMAEWTTQVQETLYPFLTSTFIDSAARVVDGVQAASGIVVDQLTGTYADEVLQYAYNRMVGIGESLWLNIRDQLVEGYNAGESIDQIAERLATAAGLSTPRALTVARTEIISAANNGSYLQMLDAGFSESVTKVWLATEDTRTRLSHRHADDQGVELTGEFTVDIYSGDVKTGTEPMEFPGDPTATPGNIINCRCSLAFDFEDEAEEVLVAAAAFVEKDHPRDGDGKFKKKGSADKFVPNDGDSDYVKNAKGKAKSITNLFTIHKTSMTTAKAADIVQNLEQKAWDLLDDDIKDMLEKKALGNKAKKISTEAKLKTLKSGAGAPSTNASKFEKIDWILKNKWDNLPAGQKTALIKNLDEDTWGKLSQPEKDKVLDAPNTTSHPEAKAGLQKALDDKADVFNAPEEADDDADTDAAPAGSGSRPVGGVDTKTGKALTPGKSIKLRVQVLYNTKFDDGAIMAVRKDSGERIVWNENTKKIERQKLSAAGKYETTEALSRGAAYAAWKDEDGWTVPDPADFASAPTTTPDAQPSIALGKSTSLKVQLIYQTPFDDGDIVAVNKNSGDVIKWDAKKKRMVIHHAKGGTTEYTRGALYKEYKDSEGWHLPADKKAVLTPAPVPAKKALPKAAAAPEPELTPAKAAAPVAKSAKPKAAATPTAVEQVNTDSSKTPKFTSADVNGMMDVADSDQWPNGTVLWEDDQTLITKYNQDGDFEVTSQATGKNEVIKAIQVDAGTVNSAVENVAMPDAPAKTKPVSDTIPVVDPDEIAAPGGSEDVLPAQTMPTVHKVLSPEAADDISASLGNSNVPDGTVLFESANTLIFKDSDGKAKITYADSDGIGSATINTTDGITVDTLINKVLTAKAKASSKPAPPTLVSTPKPLYDPNGIIVSDDQVEGIKDAFDDAQDDDLLFENADLTVEKYTDTSVIVKSKKNPGYDATYSSDALTATHLNDFAELAEPTPPPAISTVDANQMLKNQVTWTKAQKIKKDMSNAAMPQGSVLHTGNDYVIKKGPGVLAIVSNDGNSAKFISTAEVDVDTLNAGIAEVIPSTAPPMSTPNVPVNIPAPQFPLKMSYGLLVNPKTTKYADGQIIADNPVEGERLVWDATKKKYIVQAKDNNGDWVNFFTYSKQAAYKNLKDDTGWVTPSEKFASNAGATPGSAPAPSVSGTLTSQMVTSPPVAPMISTKKAAAAKAAADKKLTFNPDQLNDISAAKIDTIPDADMKKVFDEFKTGKSTMYLTSSGEDLLEAVLRAQKKHNTANPGNQLNMLETIALVDKHSAKVAGVANNNLYREKILNFLHSPSGKKKANEVIAEFRMTPAEKAKLIADKAAAAKAELDLKLKDFHAIRQTLSTPEIRPKGAQFDAPSVWKMQSIQDKVLAQKPWTTSQKTALKKYTGSYYHSLNGMLRGKITPTPELIKDASEAQKGMRPIGEDILTFRGTGVVPGLFPGNLADYKALIGKTGVEPGFFSTSVNKPFGGQIKIEFEIPKGTPAAWVENYTDKDGNTKKLTNVSNENEVLLAAGTRFEYLSAKEEFGKIVVRVRVVP